MEVADSPVKDDDYSDVGSDDNYDDDFGEAEAPPDPIATPVAENDDYEDDFGGDDRGYDAKKEDQYADDFVADDKDDLSIVDDDADSEEDEFEKGSRPRKPRRSKSSRRLSRRRRPLNRIMGTTSLP